MLGEDLGYLNGAGFLISVKKIFRGRGVLYIYWLRIWKLNDELGKQQMGVDVTKAPQCGQDLLEYIGLFF